MAAVHFTFSVFRQPSQLIVVKRHVTEVSQQQTHLMNPLRSQRYTQVYCKDSAVCDVIHKMTATELSECQLANDVPYVVATTRRGGGVRGV
jgi:hypothetical protein